MEEMDRATLAGFRIMVAVAKADGVVDESEYEMLSSAFAGHEALLESLLSKDTEIDVDAEVAHLDPEARERVYRAAFTLAYMDDRMAHDEIGVLEKLWKDDKDKKSLLEEIVGEIWDTVHPAAIMPVADDAQRQHEIDHDTLKYCVISAIVGATPVPGLAIIADAAVLAIQVKLVRDIGQYWGHTIDARAARSLIGAAAGGLGLRVAFFNLARFVPGWGSAVAATGSFVSTYAMARVANAYFAAGRELSDEAMRDLFKKARKEGEQAYERSKGTIDQVVDAHKGEIEDLTRAVGKHELSPTDFESQLVDMVDEDVDRATR